MIKYILILTLLLSNINAKLPQEVIETFNIQKEKLLQLETSYKDYDTMSYHQKQKYAKQMIEIVPSKLIVAYQNKSEKDLEEFVRLYAPLLNYKAYFMIDKLYEDKNMLKVGIYLSKLIYKEYPTNIAYLDTYLWGMVRANRNLDMARMGYAVILKQTKSEEIQKHYDYTLQMIEELKKFKYQSAIQEIKNTIDKYYFTKLEFDKSAFFKELDTITTNDHKKFKDDANKILKKYLNDEVIVLLQDNSKLTKKQDKIKSLKYDIKDKILYLTPHLLSSTIYDELKKLFTTDTKYKKIVLDLQGNEGGSLNTVIDVISAFLPDKYRYIFNIIGKGNRTTMYATNRGKTLDTTTPLEILIDKKLQEVLCI